MTNEKLSTQPRQPDGEAQDQRRAALIERLGTFADLTSADPLEGEKGDVAYELIRQAAAQMSSDHLRLASAKSPDADGGAK
ncbi:hypothetical protein [Sphingobium sp. CCH11-B1]|uniref:hypothetical protein n=1 Tax=Sphingobium sp. CCH11-B1 TaxID=1768781 RepID=UPI000AC7C63A|nr:hypothetical protein [Sphingobium sp. CCH11-B1]